MAEDEIRASANQLRSALSRLDTNGDGFLNFQEFQKGLRDLGVQLSEQEVANIWKDAAATSTPRRAQPAGHQTYVEPHPAGFRGEDVQQRVGKKTVKTNTAHSTTNLGGGGIGYVNDDAQITLGMEGSYKHSHKKTKGFEGKVPHEEPTVEWTEGGLSTKKLKERKRQNLMPDHGHMKHIFPLQDSAETNRLDTPASGSPVRTQIDFSKGARKGSENGPYDKKSAITSHRIMQQFTDKRDVLERELSKNEQVDASGKRVLDYSGFKAGLEQGGLLMGEDDSKAMWSLVGGSLAGRTDAPEGSVDVRGFLRKLATRDAQAALRPDDGRARNPLDPNRATHPDSPIHPGEGGVRRNIRPQDDKDILAHPPTAPAPPNPSRGTRLSKTEEVVRELLRRNKRAIFRAFNADSDGGRGASLGFLDLRDRISEAGVNLASPDFEALWRRADRACVGRVTWDDVKEAFDLQSAAHRPGRGLPHLPLNEDGLTPLPGSGVRQSERLDYKGSDAPPDDSRTKGEEDGDEEEPRKRVLHSDKMIRNMFIHKADCMDSLRTAIGGRSLSEPDFKDVLAEAGVILNDDDARTLFQRTAKNGVVTAQGINAELNKVKQLSEDTPSSLLGFGTGERMFKPVGSMAKYKGSWGAEDPKLQRIYWKVANSMVGNPHRLRQLFRKFDMDRNGDVSSSEFLSALLANHVPLSREESRMLSSVADTQDRGVVLYEEFIDTVARVSGQPNRRPNTADSSPPAGVHANQSVESVASRRRGAGRVERERRGSAASVVSTRSERSMGSVASSRGTLGGGLKHERSDWMMDASLRDSERKESRRVNTTQPQLASERAQGQRDGGARIGGREGGMILHLAAPPLAFE